MAEVVYKPTGQWYRLVKCMVCECWIALGRDDLYLTNDDYEGHKRGHRHGARHRCPECGTEGWVNEPDARIRLYLVRKYEEAKQRAADLDAAAKLNR